MRPGVVVTSRAARGARGEPTATGTWFVTGFAEQGPVGEAVEVVSLDDFIDTFGERVSVSQLYDALELAFAEGLATAYVSRVAGPAPIKASFTFDDGAAADALKVEALYAGTYGNGAAGGLAAEIEEGSAPELRTVVVYLDDEEVERFADGATAAALVTLLATSDYVRGSDLAGGLPEVTATTDLAGGTDDNGNATEAQWTAALAFFTKDLGPGQVSAPGRTTEAAHKALIDHASTRNRTPYLDVADQATKVTILAAVAAVENYPKAEYAGMFGTWYEIPGVVAATVRAVPGSAFNAGVTNRTDSLEGTAGAAAAGEVSTARYATGVRVPTGGLTDEDFEELNEAGVNMGRDFRNRGVQNYGFRSVSKDSDWVQLTATRLRVSLTAKLEARALRFPFKRVDGKGKLLGEFNGEMAGVCLEEWQADALYGETPEEAFRVATDDTVNTPENIAAGEIGADVYAKFAPFAELVRVGLFKVPLTSRV